MDKNQQRLTLAGNALQGLLACQNPEKGWDIGALAVTSLKIADAVIYVSNMEKLPDLADSREQEPSLVVTQPTIITP
jgi:hypothetical protein